MGGKTRNIAIQLVMQQCCKISYIFFLPILPHLKEASDGVELTVSVFFFSWATCIPGQVTSSYNSVVSFFLIHSENSARV